MKTTKFSKIAVLALAMALLVGAICAISVSAEDSEVTLNIDSGNVVYSDMLQLAFTLKGDAPEGALPGIMVWDTATENPDATNYAYATVAASELEGATYYKTLGVAATEVDKEILVSACYRLDGKLYTAGKMYTYSIAEYAGTRLTEEITANQSFLYEKLISYALASDVVLDTEEKPVVKNYAFVKAVNGTIENFEATIGGWRGLPVLLRAEAKNADGEYFLYWQNEEGEAVSYNRLYNVIAPESGIDEYTAVYGDAADSMYASTLDFESKDVGKYSGSLSGFSSSVVAGYGVNYITESLTGDKEIRHDRTNKDRNYTLENSAVPAGAVGFEFDVTFEELVDTANNTNLNHITVYLKDGDGTTLNFRMFNFNNYGKTEYYYITPGTSGTRLKDTNGRNYNFYLAPDEVLTLGFVFEKTTSTDEGGATTYGCDIKVYVNGEYVNTYDITSIGAFTAAANYADFDLGTLELTGHTFVGYNAAVNDVRMDNMTFFTEYKD